MNEKGFKADRVVQHKAGVTCNLVIFSDFDSEIEFTEVGGIIQLPHKFELKGHEVPQIYNDPLLARVSSLLASFLSVDTSATEKKGTCQPTVQFSQFTQCGMKTVMDDNQLRSIILNPFFKGYPICNALELAHHFMVRLAGLDKIECVMFIHLILTKLFPTLFVRSKVGKTYVSMVAQDYLTAFKAYPEPIRVQLQQAIAKGQGVNIPLEGPGSEYLPKRLVRGIPITVGMVKTVTLDVLLEYIAKCRAARGEDLQNSSAFTSDYTFGGFHTKRYILAEVLSHLIAVLGKYHKIVINAKKSMLDVVCAIAKIFVNHVFYVRGQALAPKDVARFPNVHTITTIFNCADCLVIDMELPPLVSKGKRDTALSITRGWDDDVKERVALYRSLKAAAVVVAGRLYYEIPGLFAYSYFPHSLSGYYSTVDWATVVGDDLRSQLKPLIADFTPSGEGGKTCAFWTKSYNINRNRTFYALTLSGMDGIMSYERVSPPLEVEDGKGGKTVIPAVKERRYLTSYYRPYVGEAETTEGLLPAEIQLVNGVEPNEDDKKYVKDDMSAGLAHLTMVDVSPSSTAAPFVSIPSAVSTLGGTVVPKMISSAPKLPVGTPKLSAPVIAPTSSSSSTSTLTTTLAGEKDMFDGAVMDMGMDLGTDI
jgi:hypothetical protein